MGQDLLPKGQVRGRDGGEWGSCWAECGGIECGNS